MTFFNKNNVTFSADERDCFLEFFADGMGEVIKYGMIRSPKIFDMTERFHDIEKDFDINDIIRECVSIKAQIVENDEPSEEDAPESEFDADLSLEE